MIRIVCLNTKEIFESAQVAGEFAGVDRSTINRVSNEDTYRLGAGAHPVTEEKLYWLREYLYDPNKNYDDLPKTKRRIGFKSKKPAVQEPVICLNTGERFETLLQAAEFASVKPRSIIDRSLSDTFVIGAGFNSSVEGKLFWIREKIYDRNREYMAEINAKKGSKVRKKRNCSLKSVVCLNTKEIFETAELAAKWAGVSEKTIIQNSTLHKFMLGVGEHPDTGERLYWLREELYKTTEEYDLANQRTSYLNSELEKEVICLNTLEEFPSFKKAAEWAGIMAGSLLSVSGLKTYAIGRGYHPDTGERLYWLRKKLYNPQEVYEIPKGERTERERLLRNRMKIVCLNNGKVFENVKEAAEWAKVSRDEIIKKSKIKYMAASTGFNEEVGERLFWLRESEFDPTVDYIKEYELNVRDRKTTNVMEEKVYCLNNKMCFENLMVAAEWATINNVELLKRYSTKVECKKSIGKHPKTGEKLYWLRESFYNESDMGLPKK